MEVTVSKTTITDNTEELRMCDFTDVAQLRVLLSVVFLATALAFIIMYLNPGLPHNRVRLYVDDLARRLLTVGAYIAVNGLVALYILELSFQFRVLRFQNRVLRLKQRILLFHINQSLSKNGGKRKLFQYVRDYTHEVILNYPNKKDVTYVEDQKSETNKVPSQALVVVSAQARSSTAGFHESVATETSFVK